MGWRDIEKETQRNLQRMNREHAIRGSKSAEGLRTLLSGLDLFDQWAQGQQEKTGIRDFAKKQDLHYDKKTNKYYGERGGKGIELSSADLKNIQEGGKDIEEHIFDKEGSLRSRYTADISDDLLVKMRDVRSGETMEQTMEGYIEKEEERLKLSDAGRGLNMEEMGKLMEAGAPGLQVDLAKPPLTKPLKPDEAISIQGLKKQDISEPIVQDLKDVPESLWQTFSQGMKQMATDYQVKDWQEKEKKRIADEKAKAFQTGKYAVKEEKNKVTAWETYGFDTEKEYDDWQEGRGEKKETELDAPTYSPEYLKKAEESIKKWQTKQMDPIIVPGQKSLPMEGLELFDPEDIPLDEEETIRV